MLDTSELKEIFKIIHWSHIWNVYDKHFRLSSNYRLNYHYRKPTYIIFLWRIDGRMRQTSLHWKSWALWSYDRRGCCTV